MVRSAGEVVNAVGDKRTAGAAAVSVSAALALAIGGGGDAVRGRPEAASLNRLLDGEGDENVNDA